MDLRLDIFLGCVSVTMFINIALLFLVYKTMSVTASKVMDKVSELETGGQALQVLTTLANNSAEAARITGLARERMVVLSKELESVEIGYSKFLSTSDAVSSVAFRAIHLTAATAQKVITFPVKNTLLVASMLQRLVGFIRRRRNGVGAMSTLNQ